MDNVLQSLIVSASLGALIGLIRQWAEQQHPKHDNSQFAGLRTFILWALIGYTAAFISQDAGTWPLLVALILVGTHITVLSLRPHDARGVGLTTGAAALITVFLGALVCWGHLLLAVMLAALTMIVLGIKQFSHSWTRQFTTEDIRSTLQFVAVTGVVLPLVPNQGFGPYEAINPHSLWLMVVFISSLGFVGYIMMRWLGAQAGVALTGLIGGLASSTATTLAFSRESKVFPKLSESFAIAIIMACTMMPVRVLVVLAFILPEFLPTLWLPFLIISCPALLYGLLLQLRQKSTDDSIDTPDLKNPLGLKIAIKFALIYGVISFLVKLCNHTGLTDGLLALSFISGLSDMDAITLSVTQNLKIGAIDLELASKAIILAAISNTLLKATFVIWMGSPELKKHIICALGSTALAGVGVFFFML